MRVLVLSLCVLVSPLLSLSPTSYLAAHDKARLAALFSSSLAGGDTATTHYSVLGLLALQEKVADTKGLCSAAAAVANDNNVETLYHAAEAAKALGCPITLGRRQLQRSQLLWKELLQPQYFLLPRPRLPPGLNLTVMLSRRVLLQP